MKSFWRHLWPSATSADGILSELHSIVEPLVYFVFPNFCLTCAKILGRGELLFCNTCWEAIPKAEPTECPFCWVRNPAPYCQCLEFRQTHLQSLVSGWMYRGPAKDIVHQIKYGRKRKLGMDAGVRLAQRIAGCLPKVDFAMPVPGHAARVRERGFNQAGVIAQGFCREARIPLRADLLQRVRWTSSQTRLNRKIRLKNIAGNFAVPAKRRSAIQGASILLLDDVLTTGATLSECSRVLLESGAARVSAVTLVRVPELREIKAEEGEVLNL